MSRIHIYVSPNGNDSAEGTRQSPLATLFGARDYLRTHEHTDGVTVTFLEGVYKLDKSVIFTDDDSGCDDLPITYEGEGNVIFSGGEYVCHCKIGSVTDEAMAKRIPDVDKVKVIDINHLGLDPEKTLGAIENTPRFYAGDKLYETARYPNREKVEARNGPYIYSPKIKVETEESESEKPEKRLTFYYDNDDVKPYLEKWTQESYEDAFIYGYFWHQWVYCRYKPLFADAQNGTLTAVPHRGGYEKDGETEGKRRRQFITNLPEELDDEGEYYYDRKKGLLYFIPYSDFNENTEMAISLLETPAVKVEGARNIVFKNIKFRYYVGQAITVENADSIVFDTCEISHTSDRAITVTASSNCKFVSCDIFDHACGGIYFKECGDRYNLIHSGNEVKNCIIHHVTQIMTVYQAAIDCSSCCGILIKGNTLSYSPHLLVLFTAVNDIVIEDNIIKEACLDTDDASAVYWGRDPSELGIVIRNNYFTNIGNSEADYSLAAIYIDDWATGADIYNNVFYNTGILTREKMTPHTNATSIVLNNAQFMNAHNNIFVGTYQDQKPTNLYACPSYIIWMTFVYGLQITGWNKEAWYDRLEKAGFFTQKWRDHYRDTIWAGMWDYANEDIHRRIAEYRDAHADEDMQKVNVDITWEIFNEAWDHLTEEGEHYDGTFLEYYKERYGEELAKHFAEYEKNLPSKGSAIADHIFWKLVYHELTVRTTNVFRNNLSIGMSREYLREDEHLKGNVMNGFYQNYLPLTDKLANGESMFVEYGKDFELTPAGIKEVHKHIPEFHNISMKNIGAKR